MPINTQYRTQESEIMDDFSLQGKDLKEALDQIARINQLLGGNKVTLHGVKKILKNWTALKQSQLPILDAVMEICFVCWHDSVKEKITHLKSLV